MNSVAQIDDEQSIVHRWHQGDKEAFEYLVHKYKKQAYSIALGFVGQHDDAIDLSQEAFVRVYRHRRSFDPDRRFFPWFYQVLKNLCFTWLKERTATRTTTLEESQSEERLYEESSRFDPELIAERDELKDAVWKAISRLNPREREIIILRHFQDLSYREISELLGCNMGTVMSRLYYARKALKDIVEKMGIME